MFLLVTKKKWRFYPSYPVHVFGAGIGGKHTEDPCAAANIQDNFVFEHVLVVVHGVPVGQRPHLVLQHLLFELKRNQWSFNTELVLKE